MCIYINMSVMEKVFHYEATELSVIKFKDEIWFKAKQVALLLGYLDPGRSIRQNVDPEDRIFLEKLIGKGEGDLTTPLVSNFQGSTLYLNESCLYSLIFGSKLASAKAFKRWVTKHALPSIRKTGRYYYCMNHKYNNTLTFKIENETGLHVKVVSFLKKRFPYSIFVSPLGENQDTSIKRIDSFNKGHIKGTPDLIINNLHRCYTGFTIEFKTPKGYGTLSNEQSNILFHYQLNGFKTLVSNDYDRIVEELLVYFKDVRVKCSFCPRRFISSQSLRNYIKGFHKM